ncbi:MAG: hypothetical protein ACOZQL_18095 [Myxococcota bacterium]
MVDPWLVGFFGVAIVSGLALSHFRSEGRTREMRQWAEWNDFAFEGDGRALFDELARFDTFDRERFKTQNLMRATKGEVEVRLADFKLSADADSDWSSLCVVTGPGRPAPHFSAHSKTRIQPPDFEVDLFSQTCVVRSLGDAQAVERLLTPDLRLVLSGLVQKYGSLEASGDTLLLFAGRLVKVEELDELITDALTLRRHWS